MESLGDRLNRMESIGSELERTIASAVRELAGDMMRAYRGEQPEFSFRYADRYDLALTKSAEINTDKMRHREEEDNDEQQHEMDGFRGEGK